MDDRLKEIRDNFRKFQQRRALQEKSEFVKTCVAIFVVVSVIGLNMIGDEAAEAVIWYWVGFMVLLVILCIIIDIVVARKIKKLGL